MTNLEVRIRIAQSLAEVSAGAWNNCAGCTSGLSVKAVHEVEFTGVGILPTGKVTPHLRRKALTRFRESETPALRRDAFSRPCPRLRVYPVPCLVDTEVPFFRHFSVMPGGIKT
jgi:hypothetical protein